MSNIFFRNFPFFKLFIFNLIFFLLTIMFLYPLDPSIKMTQYLIDLWNETDGIPQNTITALLQTRDGYIWVGTQEGLARFNGRRFESYTKENNTVIGNDYIIALFEDNDGVLWIGSREGLLKYENNMFRKYSKYEGLTNNLIRSIVQDNNGTIWVGTEGGLFYKRGEHFFRYKKNGIERVNKIKNDPFNNKIFLGTNEGLFFIKEMEIDNVDLGKRLTANIVRDILVVSGSEILVATMGSGIVRIKDGVMKFINTNDGLSSNNISSISGDSDGNYWVGSDKTGGINRIKIDGIDYFREERGFPCDSIYSIMEDREKNIWIGTEKGLVKLREGIVKMITVREGLISNIVTPVICDKDKIWIGTDRGISMLNGDSILPYKEDIFKDLKINSFYLDIDKNLWAGTFGDGVIRDGQGGIKYFTMKDGLPSDTVFSITGNGKGTIWFGTNGGLARLKHGVFTSYGKDDGLSNLINYNIMIDSRGYLWICTGGGGVYRFRDGVFLNFSVENGLSDNFALSLYEDKDKNIWVGTSNGLNFIKGENVSVIKKKNGLFNNVVFTILEDKDGVLWMSSNKGIYNVKRTELIDFVNGKVESISCKSFTSDDGMSSSECSGGFSPAGWESDYGKLYFSSTSGLVTIDPTKIKKNIMKPPVVIEKILIDGTPVNTGKGKIEVKSDTDKLEIHFAVLSYQIPKKNKVKFFLDGYDKKWEELNQSKQWIAFYTNLSPGDYIFRVKGANGDGVWNEVGTEINIVIEPFFWETTWFKIVSLFFFSILSYFIISLLKKYITILTFWKEKNYINHYKIIEKIGTGGMGTVYKAKDILTNKIYAVKVLKDELFDNKEQITRLKNEGIIIDRLKHRNIVRIFERGEYKGGLYIVMELLSGESLFQYIRKNKNIDIKSIVEIMIQISESLVFIHSKNIIHRDIKPENIKLEISENGQLVVKLLDFGLAKIDTFTKLTQTGAIMGSIHYLSPEQLKGRMPNDKSDIFSVGIVLYELITGEKPFKGDTAVEVMQEILGCEAAYPENIFKDIPKDLKLILSKMLSKKSEERPSAVEVRDFFKFLI